MIRNDEMTDNEYKVHENNFVNSRTVTVIYSTVATNIIRMLYVMMIMMIVITIIVIISRERENVYRTSLLLPYFRFVCS